MDDSPLFSGISDKSRTELRKLAVQRTFLSGEMLFRQGEAPSQLFLLCAGRVKIWRTTEDGAALTLTILGIGQPFGTLGAALDRPNNASATALDAVNAQQWRIGDVRRIMADDPQLTANVLRTVTSYAEQLIERLGEMSGVPVEQRLARALLRLSRQDGGEANELHLSRQELAELTSSTLATISRTMSRWRGDALVDGGRARVVLLDRAGLERIAGA